MGAHVNNEEGKEMICSPHRLAGHNMAIEDLWEEEENKQRKGVAKDKEARVATKFKAQVLTKENDEHATFNQVALSHATKGQGPTAKG